MYIRHLIKYFQNLKYRTRVRCDSDGSWIVFGVVLIKFKASDLAPVGPENREKTICA